MSDFPKFLCLDIETAPNPEELDRVLMDPPVFSAPRNYKDQEKIDAYIQSEAMKWRIETTRSAALDRFLLRVVSVGVGWGEDVRDGITETTTTAKSCVFVQGDQGERELLEFVAERLHGSDLVVTFNGNNFDGPILRHRMMRHGVHLPKILTGFPRYRNRPWLDLRGVLTDWDQRQRGTIQDFCREFGVTPPEKTDPDEIARMYQAGERDGLELKSAQDAGSLWDLYTHLNRLGLFD